MIPFTKEYTCCKCGKKVKITYNDAVMEKSMISEKEFICSFCRMKERFKKLFYSWTVF